MSAIRFLNALFLVVGLIGLTIAALQIDPARLAAGVDELGLGLLLAVLIHFGVIFCDSTVLALATAQPIGPRFLLFVYRAGLAGHAIGLVTPTAVGELTKYTLLSERVPREETAAAILCFNFLSFEMTCLFMVAVPLASSRLLDLPSALQTTLNVSAALCFALAVSVPFLLRRGAPEWPYRLLGRFVSAARVERAHGFVDRTAAEVHRLFATPRRLLLASGMITLARLGSVLEIATLLAFLHAGAPPIVSFLILVTGQIVRSLVFFVPFQGGTSEASAYLLFQTLAIEPSLGIVLELAKKAIRIGFVGVGVVILGWKNVRRLRNAAR